MVIKWVFITQFLGKEIKMKFIFDLDWLKINQKEKAEVDSLGRSVWTTISGSSGLNAASVSYYSKIIYSHGCKKIGSEYKGMKRFSEWEIEPGGYLIVISSSCGLSGGAGNTTLVFSTECPTDDDIERVFRKISNRDFCTRAKDDVGVESEETRYSLFKESGKEIFYLKAPDSPGPPKCLGCANKFISGECPQANRL